MHNTGLIEDGNSYKVQKEMSCVREFSSVQGYVLHSDMTFSIVYDSCHIWVIMTLVHTNQPLALQLPLSSSSTHSRITIQHCKPFHLESKNIRYSTQQDEKRALVKSTSSLSSCLLPIYSPPHVVCDLHSHKNSVIW